jgi:uncharacterized membrane protein
MLLHKRHLQHQLRQHNKSWLYDRAVPVILALPFFYLKDE